MWGGYNNDSLILRNCFPNSVYRNEWTVANSILIVYEGRLITSPPSSPRLPRYPCIPVSPLNIHEKESYATIFVVSKSLDTAEYAINMKAELRFHVGR